MYKYDLCLGREEWFSSSGKFEGELREEKVEIQDAVPAKHEIKIAKGKTIEEMGQDLLRFETDRKLGKVRKEGKILKKMKRKK